MKSRHRCSAATLVFVVDKGTVTLGDKKHAFDLLCGIAREVILQINDLGPRR
jgi:hypothetical protein